MIINELQNFQAWLKNNGNTQNPWKDIAENTLCQHGLYSKESVYAADVDRKNYTFKALDDADYKEYDFVVNVPPEPWQGNPLIANLVILTLNPGFVKKQNKDLAIRIQNDSIIRKEIIQFKSETLLLKSDSFLPAETKNGIELLSAADYLNTIGDWYWYKRFLPIMSNNISEEDFYKQVAIVQYNPYQSVIYKDSSHRFESQEYTRKILEYILKERKDVTILIMRSASKWQKLIKEQLNIDLSATDTKNRFIYKHNTIIFNYNRSQAISENNLGSDNFKIIKESIK